MSGSYVNNAAIFLVQTDFALYILAVMLERKKLLKQVDVTESEESRMLFYEHVKSGEAFIVRDPMLKLEEVDAIQEEVAGWLGGGKPAQKPGLRAHSIWIEADYYRPQSS